VHTDAWQLLVLMQIKLEGTRDDDEAPPVFYVVLIFVQTFSRAWFINHFHWRMRSNPNFGKGAYGQLSPYCLEHTYVMSRDLEAMENGRYKTHPAFAHFMQALEKEPVDNNITGARSAYFEKFPSIFFEMFCSMFNKHIVSHWRDKKHLVYMIGSTPSLAK
jgi:hypothetical protein